MSYFQLLKFRYPLYNLSLLPHLRGFCAMESEAKIPVENPLKEVENGTDSADEKQDEFVNEWGFHLDALYRISKKFYKEKEGKAVHLSYPDKTQLVALTKQVAQGPCKDAASVGFLDVVGNDRRQAWQKLGEMSRESAMAEFVRLLDTVCPLLRPYVQAHRTERDEQDRIRHLNAMEKKAKEEEEREHYQMQQEVQRQQEEESTKRQQQEIQIRAALNQQTSVQFRQYAEQQFPSDVQKQDHLILQLQEQHFQQYMQQVYQQQISYQQQLCQQQQQQQQNQQYQQSQQNHRQKMATSADNVSQDLSQATTELSELSLSEAGDTGDVVNGHAADGSDETEEDADSENDEDDDDELPPIALPQTWERKNLKEFKESLKKDKDAVIKVGCGETVTVRVPTHEDGTCLFWEFATDNYDIGFGVYFEWTIAPSNAVSVHVSESSDEEEEEETGGEGKPGDIEKGSKQDNRPPTDEIIAIYRRNCHEEVYCGSHMYPGQGVYLLKFDNSYSLWRSKTLYYRVYYTR